MSKISLTLIRFLFIIFIYCIFNNSLSSTVMIKAIESYTITLESYETSGETLNLGYIFVDGIQLPLPNSLIFSEGQHSIFYYSEEEDVFTSWESSGNVTILGSAFTNGNMFQISGPGTIKARYSPGPQLYIEILSPTNNEIVDEDIVQLKVRITAETIPISDSLTTFYINDKIIDTNFTDERGIAQINYSIKPFKEYEVKVTVEKRGYKNGNSQIVTFRKKDIYHYSLSPENNKTIIEIRFFLNVRFFINNIPAEDVEVYAYLDGQYLGNRTTSKNGYASLLVDDIKPGNHRWYAIFEKENMFSVRSHEVNFNYYGDIWVNALDTSREDVNFTDIPTIILKTKLVSRNNPVPDMKVNYYVNNELIGYKYTDSTGYSEYSYPFYDSNVTIVWYSSITVVQTITINSSIQTIQLSEFIPYIQTSLISPKNSFYIKPWATNVILKCNATINNLPIENILIQFYVNNSYIGYNYTNKYGISSLKFNPDNESTWYNWYAIGSKYNAHNNTSNIYSFYYPIKPTNISIINSIVSDSRADLNSTQYVGFQLVWENGLYLSSVDVIINNHIRGRTNNTGWVFVLVNNSRVGTVEYNVTDILCEGVGNIQHEFNPNIIWDRVVFHITLVKSRYDVGTYVHPSVLALYEADGTPFIGNYSFNAELYSNVTRHKEVYISEIVDELYNISMVKSNKLKIVWDRILFTSISSQVRYPLGSNYLPSLIGEYEYDKSKFNGHYSLDNVSQYTSVGASQIKNLDVYDNKHMLSNYFIENTYVIYDEIVVEKKIITKYPGKYVLTIRPFFLSDKQLVNATIITNGVVMEYDGILQEYRMVTNSWNFVHSFRINIEYINFDDINYVENIIHIENIYCIINFGMFPISTLMLYIMIRSTKAYNK